MAYQGEEESAFVKRRRRNWARLIKKTWFVDLTLCPACRKPMEVLAAISSPEQDDVIERIVRAQGEWNPLWKRSLRARGPPPSDPSTPICPREAIDPQYDVDDYFVDPYPVEDL